MESILQLKGSPESINYSFVIHSSFFKKVYLKSLTPFELLAFSKQHDCIFKGKDYVNYLDDWKKSISKDGSNETFEEYYLFYDLSNADISLMTSSIDGVKNDINFPDWVKILEEVVSNVNFEPEKFNANNGTRKEPFYQLLYPFIDFFSKKLRQNLITSNITFLSQTIIDNLGSALYKDLFNIAHLVFLDEFSKFKEVDEKQDLAINADDFFYKRFVSSILSDGFQNLFLRYPLLARKLALKAHQLLAFIVNIFKRFQSDKAEIEYYFDVKLRQLVHLHLNSGDQHNGESTVIFEFENAYKIVYKPTNVAITLAYNRFLEWVNVNMGEDLKSFKVIDKNTYGWLQFIEHSECNSTSDIKLYYERAGILLGVAYFLNAKDYHYDNVIASGNCPVLVDHETTIGPTVKKMSAESNNEEPSRTIVGTILESLLLPTNNQGVPPYISGFGSSIQLSINCDIPKIENCNTDSMKKVSEMVCRNLYKSNKPRLNNRIENLVDYQTEFTQGFFKTYNLILKNKAQLLSDDSPLQHFENVKVRFINRPTGVYFKLFNLLNKPQYLRDSILYGLKLELLARAYAANSKWSRILSSEREQMLVGDIPVFYTDTLADSLVLPNGQTEDSIETSAFESVIGKIKKANSVDCTYQMNLIQEVIAL